MPICPVFGLVSWICPDIDKLHYISPYTNTTPLMLTCWSLYRPNEYTEKSLQGGQGSASDPAAGAHDAHLGPKLDPDGSRIWCSYPTTVRIAPLALVPDYDAQVMVTLGQYD